MGKEALTDQVLFSNWSSGVFEVFCGFYWGVIFLEWMALTGNMLFSLHVVLLLQGDRAGQLTGIPNQLGAAIRIALNAALPSAIRSVLTEMLNLDICGGF